MPANNTRYLDGDGFATALASGIHRVIGDQDELNRINVFPVADGDTGTNLSLSLAAALELIQQPGEKQLGKLLAAVADVLLDGARGNSGAILAQFFQGLGDSAGELTRFTTYTFSKAVSQGSEYAHEALSNPREGTILSVIGAYAAALAHRVGQVDDADFAVVLEPVLPEVEKALAATTSQLEALRKADVVDAGARGFVDLVRGFHDVVVHGRETPRPELTLIHTGGVIVTDDEQEYAYRYCTECIIAGKDIDIRRLREAFSRLGDSLVVAGGRRKAKIHIHANEPIGVFDLAREFGDVSAEKADDLHRQQHSSHDASRRFAVITDSAADITVTDLEQLDIHVVPCRVQFGDHGYLDKVGISAAEFFAELTTNPAHPTTSQPAPGDFRRQFEFLASHFADVLSINLSSAASGTFEAAKSAAGRTDSPGQVHVVDSLNASVGQGLLVVYAAECAAAGLTLRATLAAVNGLVPLTRTYGVLSNLDYAVRGGRFPGWVRTLAAALRLTPIIRTTPDGRIGVSGAFFGQRNRVRRLARHTARRARSLGPVRVAIGHAVCADDAAELEKLLRMQLASIVKLSITELGAALGVHGGPGTLVVAVRPDRPPAG